VDNTSALIKPNMHVAVSRYIKSAIGVNKKEVDGVGAKMLNNLYGLDYFLEDEKVDVMGNPYPETNDVQRFITEIPKQSELYPKSTGLLFKFDRGVNVSKWRANELKAFTDGFSLYGQKYMSTDDSLTEEAIKYQQDLFRSMVERDYDYLNSIETFEDLESELKAYQLESKKMTKEFIVTKYLDVTDKNSKIIIPEQK